jgi:hypothetical protein
MLAVYVAVLLCMNRKVSQRTFQSRPVAPVAEWLRPASLDTGAAAPCLAILYPS